MALEDSGLKVDGSNASRWGIDGLRTGGLSLLETTTRVLMRGVRAGSACFSYR